jgi:diguanylate cyclase (GGDEF)-like protein/hemerythrin-like metal-binding protein
MSQHVLEGLGGEVRELLERFPFAITLIGSDGALAWCNGRYRERFDPAVPEAQALAACGETTGGAPKKARLRRKGGGAGDVLVHCLTVAGRRMLVLDETPGEVDAATVRDLQAQVATLERESLTDRLTGLWNRRYLEKTLPGELARSRRYRQPLGVALLDIDNFKRINDRFGHLAGDAVLRELAALARGALRVADSVVRWGGEELLVLMPFATHRAAAAAAEKLRLLVQAHAFDQAGSVTISAGVAEALAGEDAESLFKRADAALYSAKNAGRNRVVADAQGASDLWAMGDAAIVQIVWREAYACGEPAIDAQHEMLFRLANALIAASMRQADDRGAFLASLEALLAHVAQHFASEEAILQARGYAQLAQHRAAHRALLERAAALKEAAPRGDAAFGALVEFLAQEVVAQHLLTADRDFFPLFAAR